MPPPSIARDFFEQIRNAADSVALIRGLYDPASPTFETDWLDFKQQPSPNLMDRKWREIWVEALAGFANNEGGVVIWGIDARKDPATNVDAACGEVPVDNPKAVKSRLIELQRQATDPPLANVEIDAYEIPTSPGKGFVVCFVPQGPYRPYRAEDGRKSQYYVRSGDNFTILSRSMLQALFYPRTKAVFRAKAKLTWDLARQPPGGRDAATLFTCGIALVNDGAATTRDAFVTVKSDLKGMLGGPRFLDGPWLMSQSAAHWQFEATRPTHPGLESRLLKVE
jgi:hypothetical protein